MKFKSKFNAAFEKEMKIISEGGHVLGDVTTAIAKDNIKPTVSLFADKVFRPIGITDDCWTSEIGSTGKKDFSGDIDIALNYDKAAKLMGVESADDVTSAIKDKMTELGIEFVAKNGLNCKVPIQGTQQGEFVQLDIFKTTSLDFTKFAKFGPSQTESKYKGAIRSDLLCHLIAVVTREAAEEGLEDGVFTSPTGEEYPAKTFTQYSIFDDGVYKLKKTFKNKAGTGVNKNPSEVKGNRVLVTQCPQELIDMLFGKGRYTQSDFNSFESILNNVILTDDFPYKDKIKTILKKTYDGLVIKNAPIPEELTKLLKENN